ncbi:sulfite exporter TauE/SafE family protein [Marinobacter sp. 1_MG-2023]|uniref:sulfite exporter TauE/SafE family protein n=1 Tax=Marinobacter sp. 1_MG-2023 TaxID=3062627 RepID=UPI0026E18F88|nr:sulfite exporter TauE/SafE family protein [Marinobacter sp. 1_MG-2023]MDO6824389.1 sulfite exporter TauE/SafE family protein [Marinobacter sp. 1_MG-2023]
MEFDALTIVILTLVIPASFLLSAAAGLGGSLVLVPGLMLAIGTREGIAVAALLLACNNIAKVIVYRNTLPWASSALIVVAVMVGSALGAILMLQMPEVWVRYAVATMLLLTLAGDFFVQGPVRKAWAVFLAFLSGSTSGFSGTSGPLKGVALRSLQLERFYFVGAASLVSMVGDMTKALVFSQSGLISTSHLLLAGALVPVMAGCTLLGRKINRDIGEKWYSILFWTVMGGYLTRLMVA